MSIGRASVLGLALATGLACGTDDVSTLGHSESTTPLATGPGSEDTHGASGSTVDTQGSSAGMDGSSSGDSSSSDATGSPMFPEACEEPEASIEVSVAAGPEGPVAIDEAWLGFDVCSGAPYVMLVQYPTTTAAGLEIELFVDTQDLPTDPLFGLYPVRMSSGAEGAIEGTIDVLEPLADGTPGVPTPDRHLHGRIEVHDAAWDLSLEVDLIDCGVSDCFCPCR